jgi:hypothetical protein
LREVAYCAKLPTQGFAQYVVRAEVFCSARRASGRRLSSLIGEYRFRVIKQLANRSSETGYEQRLLIAICSFGLPVEVNGGQTYSNRRISLADRALNSTTKSGHLWLCDSDRLRFRRLLEALSILADMENSMNNSPTLAP